MTPRDSWANSGSVRAPARAAGPATGGAPPESPLGLRLRVWIACLAGALVSAFGLWWVAGTQLTLNADPAHVLAWLAGIGGLGLVVGVGFSLWLDHGVVSHLRGLTRGLASGRVQELRGLPAASGWGELSELTEWAQVLITRQRQSNRATEDLEQLETALAQSIARLEAWRSSDRWEALPPFDGTGGVLARELNESFARTAELNEQNLEAARRVRSELLGAAGDARDSADQAERGFVEATALLTTVRELQRLGQELRQAMNAGEVASPAVRAMELPGGSTGEAGSADLAAGDDRLARYRDAVEAALEELILSSNASVEHLGTALRRVQEIAAQVQIVSQRATLVALHAVTLESRLPREERRGEELSHELRQLTSEVRAAAQQADALTAEVERETRAADERMRAMREHVAPQLEPPGVEAMAPPASAAPISQAASESVARLLERVREMIQDATRKGERLSASGERASRTAERLVRRLEDEAREVDGLMVRLSPAGEMPAEAHGSGAIVVPAGAELHLLEGDDPDEIANDAGPEGIAGEERP